MTKEQKQLLLVDLCARLTYRVYIETEDGMQGELISVVPSLDDIQFKPFDCKMTYISTNIEKVKPYLRPMSSMTAEELYEYQKFIIEETDETAKFCNQMIFYNKYHFDYRGLIPMGLAIEVTEEDNPYKQ